MTELAQTKNHAAERRRLYWFELMFQALQSAYFKKKAIELSDGLMQTICSYKITALLD